jgi:cytochrome c-type biogenesis protein CcmH/NrfG
MKKVEKVEVAYVKRNTMILVAALCLVAGFIGGTFYVDLSGGNSGGAQTALPPQSTPAVDPQLQLIQTLKDRAAVNPADASAWVQLGNAYFDANQPGPAIDAYKKHLELNPGNANAWTDLGVMYRRNNQPVEAIKAFDMAMEKDPAHQQSRFNKGIVLMYDLQKREEAVKVWEELVKLNPQAMAPNGQPVAELLRQLKAAN